MIYALLILLGGTVLGNVVQVLVAKGRKASYEKAQRHIKQLENAYEKISARAERLQKALDGNLKAEEAAEYERKELAGTDDSDLVHRANRLFGVHDDRDKPGTGS